ncbi:MAG: helix-turn-helix transcriptional regulator [Chloroflexota bacterium]|nr:helix-turn-helix transcriptional regulator [Chloroflexota bacterium]
MPSRNPRRRNHRQRKGHRRRDGRTVVRLDAAALFQRLEMLGRSQNWLAKQVGVTPAYVSMLVNGGRSPSGRIRRRMLRALGVTRSRQLFKTEVKHEPQ